MFPLLVLAASLSADPAEVKYAKPEYLVEAAEASAKTYRIYDVRKKADYEEGHIPGSFHLVAGPWSKAINDDKADAKFWSKALAEAGFEPKAKHLIVAEDIKDACRVWWTLKLAGVPHVAVLNGGWTAYAAAKLDVSKEAVAPKVAEPHDWTPTDRHLKKSEIVKWAEGKLPGIIDARGAKEYGDGRIPTATMLEWSDLIDSKTKKFKPAAELKTLIDDRKIDLSKPCATYCQGGGRASVLAFGLELMGAKDVKNYFRSWGEYGSDADTPKEKSK